MRLRLLLPLALVGCLAPIASLSATPEAPKAAAVIAQLRAESNSAIAAHDADRIGSFLTEDFQITVSTGAALAGREAMAKGFRDQFEKSPDIVYVRTPELIEISSSHPLASERGRWVGRWTDGDKAIEVSGSYQAMWRYADGRWLIRAELFVALKRTETAK